MKEKVKYIKAEDLSTLEKDAEGNYLIPEGYEIYKVKSKQDKIAARIATLEEELDKMTEPTDQELIEEGRMMHPYFMMVEELEMLKREVE